MFWFGHDKHKEDLYQPLSRNHLDFGVSQYWAGNAPSAFNVPVILMNPNHNEHLIATFFYESARGFSGGTSEVFLDCDVRVVTGHGSVGIDDPGRGVALYVEMLAVPKRKVTLPDQTQTRIADGAGIIAETAGAHRP